MKLRVEKTALAAGLKTVLPAVGKTGLPVITGVRISRSGDGLELCCTDLQLTITTSIAGTCDSDEPVVVPAGQLAKIVASFRGGAVEASSDDVRLTVSSGETAASLHTFDPATWPTARIVDGPTVTLTEHDLHQVARVAQMASLDEKRPGICVAHLIGDQVMGTDSYRGGIAGLDVEIPRPTSITAEAATKLAKNASGPAEMTVDDRAARFATGNVSWSMPLVDHEFPLDQMRQLFTQHKGTHRWTFNTEALLDAVARVQSLTSEEPIRVAVDGGKAHLSRSHFGVGNIVDTIPVDADWDATLSFNPVFLTQALGAAEAAEVTFELADELKPVLLRTERFEQLLMPVKGDKARAK